MWLTCTSLFKTANFNTSNPYSFIKIKEPLALLPCAPTITQTLNPALFLQACHPSYSQTQSWFRLSDWVVYSVPGRALAPSQCITTPCDPKSNLS